MSNEDWDRLQLQVRLRIEELDLTQAEVQARGGPSPAKVREIIGGRATALSPSKRRDLERALEWQAASVDRVLAGGEPTPLSTVRFRREVARRVLNAPATAHDEHFERAERLLLHSQESVRRGDFLGAIHGLEGAESTIELLIDRITDAAIQSDPQQENDDAVSGDQTPESDASGEAGKAKEASPVVRDRPKFPPFSAGSKWRPREDSGVDGDEEGEETHEL